VEEQLGESEARADEVGARGRGVRAVMCEGESKREPHSGSRRRALCGAGHGCDGGYVVALRGGLWAHAQGRRARLRPLRGARGASQRGALVLQQ